MVRDLSKVGRDYFEAILQLRNISEAVHAYVEEAIPRLGMRIVKEVPHKNDKDWDLYLTDNDLTVDIARKLQQKFGGMMQISPKLYGRRENKDVYRFTVLFREAEFKKGDKVTYKGDEYEVKIVAKDILLQETKTGKKVHMKYKDMGMVKKV